MALLDDINMVLRDFEVVSTAHPAPTGDPASGHHNIMLPELRELLKTIAQSMGDPSALAELQQQIGEAGRLYPSRAAAAAGAASLPSSVTQILVREGTALVLRSRTAYADDPLFEAGARWGVVQRLDVAAEAQAREAAVSAVASQVAAEVDARSGLISAAGSEGLVVADEVGFVLAQLTPDALSLMGHRTLSRAADGAFVVEDESGFVLLRVTPTSMTYMGREIQRPESLAEARRDMDAILRPVPRASVRWRHARAQAICDLETARVLWIGDSNSAGHNALGANQHRRALSGPDLTAKSLPANRHARSDAFFGMGVPTDVIDYSTYDPRLVPGAGWAPNGGNSLGGGMWRNETTSDPLAYTPSDQWDCAEIWVAPTSAFTVSVGAAGDFEEHTPPVGQITRITYRRTPTTAALEIRRVSGAVRVIGWHCFREGHGISVMGAGWSGSRSDQMADAATWYSPARAAASVGADMTFVQAGLNDYAQGRDPSEYRASLQSLCAALIDGGSDVAVVVSGAPGGSAAYLWADYTAQMYSVASELGLPVVDAAHRLGPYSAAQLAGWTNDGLHLTAAGYAETAHLAAQLLMM